MSRKEQANKIAMERIISFLQEMKYGKVEIRNHDSQITQIEKEEKYRLAEKSRRRRFIQPLPGNMVG